MRASRSPIRARAPSNIALAKYMGKTDVDGAAPDAPRNLPENPSVSMTLDRLCTEVEVAADASDRILAAAPLSAAGTEKVLRHLARLRAQAPALGEAFGVAFDPSTPLAIRSRNTFPMGAGIASSASAFAAITLGALYFWSEDRAAWKVRWDVDLALRAAVARLAREGSGSACRSLCGPFVSWEGGDVRPIESRLPPLADLVLLVGAEEKEVGSSEAHRRVRSSPHWEALGGEPGRVARATARHRAIVAALGEGDFARVAREAWDEFQDMHRLFETADPPFAYRNDDSRRVLAYFAAMPSAERPIVTMDAGPNVHVLVPEFAAGEWTKRLRAEFPRLELLRDSAGRGAECEEAG